LKVTIAKPFAVGRFSVTRGEFTAFVLATGYRTDGGCYVFVGNAWEQQGDRNWLAPGFSQTDRHPVVCVSWEDAKAYAAWLTSMTGNTYRLPSEAEREYATRAGTTTPFWWGSAISTSQANYNARATVAVDTFAANAWGLYNVHGNVWEWTEDCWNPLNAANPGDGSAQTGGDCENRSLRGGAWGSPELLRAASRKWTPYKHRDIYNGFRIARTL
jgi:formylglycine-generating enzyme required for sulfatase activity